MLFCICTHFLQKSQIFRSAKPDLELIFASAPIENRFDVKYLEMYDAGKVVYNTPAAAAVQRFQILQ